MLMAAVATPLGSVPSPNGRIPQCLQKRCLMTCLLKVYVVSSDSPVSFRCSRGTNHNSEPRFEHIEQLQATAPVMSPSTSMVTLPQ